MDLELSTYYPQAGDSILALVSRLTARLAPREEVLLSLAARTTTTETSIIINPGYTGALFVVACTVAGTGTPNLAMRTIDPATDEVFLNSTSMSFTTTGKFATLVYPGASSTGAGNDLDLVVVQPLGRRYKLRVTHTDASSWTYAASVIYLP